MSWCDRHECPEMVCGCDDDDQPAPLQLINDRIAQLLHQASNAANAAILADRRGSTAIVERLEDMCGKLMEDADRLYRNNPGAVWPAPVSRWSWASVYYLSDKSKDKETNDDDTTTPHPPPPIAG